MKIDDDAGNRTGKAVWLPLDRSAVQVDSDAEAARVGATGYGRPEDAEVGGNALYVAITSEHRVLRVELGQGNTSRVSDYVARGLNVDQEFEWPDNLALLPGGDLFIAEDPGGTLAGGKRRGDEIWLARPGVTAAGPAAQVVRFVSLTDCDAEPTGLYYDTARQRLLVNIEHRGGDGVDFAMAVRRAAAP